MPHEPEAVIGWAGWAKEVQAQCDSDGWEPRQQWQTELTFRSMASDFCRSKFLAVTGKCGQG